MATRWQVSYGQSQNAPTRAASCVSGCRLRVVFLCVGYVYVLTLTTLRPRFRSVLGPLADGESPHPQCLADAARAIRLVRRMATDGQLSVDPERVAVRHAPALSPLTFSDLL